MNKISKDSCKISSFCAQVIKPTARTSFYDYYFPLIFNDSSYEDVLNSSAVEYPNNELGIFDDFFNDDVETITDQMQFICNCIKKSYDCKLFETLFERNMVYNEILKNAYLALYIFIMVAAFVVNLILFVLIITSTQYKNFCFNFLRKFTQPAGSVATNAKSTGLSFNNLDNNILLISLLISYILTIVYVLPRQTFLFYTGLSTQGSDCRFTEFTKAFTVSLTIFSLVCLSMHQLITLKFPTLTNAYSSSYRNESFYKRKTFLCWLLFIIAWLFAFAIGYFSMQRYEDKSILLEHYETVSTICTFPSYLKAKFEYCSIDADVSAQTSVTIAFFIILLVIPNIIIFVSYGYICYHIWSTSRSFMNDKYTTSQYSLRNRSIIQEDQKTIHISVLHSEYVKFDSRNECEINKTIATAALGHLSETQVMSITKTIKSEASTLQPIWIDINYKARYNAFEIETIIKRSDISKNTKQQEIKTSNRNTSNNNIKKRNKTVTLTICLMAICFTLCWVPFFIFPLFYYKIIDNYLYINLKVAIHLIGYSSSIWIPLIYILRCERFKNSTKPLTDSLKCRIKSLFYKIAVFLKCNKCFRKSILKIKSSYFKFLKRRSRTIKVHPIKY